MHRPPFVNSINNRRWVKSCLFSLRLQIATTVAVAMKDGVSSIALEMARVGIATVTLHQPVIASPAVVLAAPARWPLKVEVWTLIAIDPPVMIVLVLVAM